MKQLLIIVSLILAFGTIKAQNNATWEETIEFINKYKSYIHHSERLYDPCGYEIKDFNISGYEMYFINRPGQGPGNESKKKIDLSKLERVEMGNKNNNRIKF